MQESKSFNRVRTGELLMGSFEVIANIALVAFALKFKRDGEKEQFLALIFIRGFLQMNLMKKN